MVVKLFYVCQELWRHTVAFGELPMHMARACERAAHRTAGVAGAGGIWQAQLSLLIMLTCGI